MWVAVCLLGGAGGMMFHFGEKVFSASWSDDESMMNVHAIGIALASIVLKEAAFHLTLRVGKRIESQAGTMAGPNSLFLVGGV